MRTIRTLAPRFLLASLALSASFASYDSLAHAAHADPRPREIMDAAQIRLGIEKLGVVGTALYVGAHPDDENTAMLAWLANGRKVRTLYLSLTRGDGGQNLIGTDVGDRLGVIRTQELLAARRVDGAEQRFTRALDFGFSKRSDETLRLWGHDRILEDVVWQIRRLRPDIVITRFPPDSTAGHGHHAASAILAAEAFRAAADSTKFPDQLAWLRPWQAKRLVWNVFRFGNSGPDTSRGRVTVDLGAYNSLLGLSYSEIAGKSRSMHKTQGFGAPERRGSFTNTFVHRDGDRATNDLFDGVDLSWRRVPGGERVQPLVEQALKEFDAAHPEASLPLLLRINGVLTTLPADPIVTQKRTEVAELIRSCSGLWLEGIAASPLVSVGGIVKINASALARVRTPLDIERVELVRTGLQPEVLSQHRDDRPLAANQALIDTFETRVPPDAESAQPYWLRRPSAGAWFEIEDPRLTGMPENMPALVVRYWLTANGEHFQIDVPVVYRWLDPVAGERYRALDVVPPVALSFGRGVYLFPDLKPRPVEVTVRSADVGVAGRVVLDLPDGWKSTPASVPIALAAGEADTLVRFTVTPAAGPAAARMVAALDTEKGTHWHQQRITLDYAHVPMQTLLPSAEARAVRADLRTSGREIGYLMGSGDQLPQALEQMGFHVTLLDDDYLEHGDLARFPVIVVGVRAYNTRPRLLAHQKLLLDWVAAGGRLVVQYNTADDGLDVLGPKPFHISRDRVTVEDAEVTETDPAHPLLSQPNKIGPADFAGWVQERGLYFANPWDPSYQAPLSCHDPGEPARAGGLLYARHGKGVFIYSGYAWFRQLPAGVPGAWRLFANLVSAAK
jgi:LmbE family N-acetylglucosaminyl deacetylase